MRAVLFASTIAAACAAVGGCGPSVEDTSSGSGGGASTASSTAVGSSASSVASSSSTGGGPVCGVEPNEHVSVRIQRYLGEELGCATSTPGGESFTKSIQGTVVTATGGAIEIDECSPAADCIGHMTRIDVTGGFVDGAFIAPGAFAEVRLQESNNPFFCVDMVMLRNMPSWDGAPNPVSQTSDAWLVASNTGGGFDDAGFGVEPVALGCFPDETSTCGVHEDYVFRVTAAGSATDVPAGQTAAIGPSWQFQNLSSYSTAICDVPASFSYLIFVPSRD